MGSSEAEIEARLAALRRQREALDREIADHVLYLELGRRLRGPALPEPEMPGPPPERPRGAAPEEAVRDASRRPVEPSADRVPEPAGSEPARAKEPAGWPAIPPAVPFEADPVAARRYGRALVEAAVAVLAAAGRPMHAGEILETLVARGFSVPGPDPVAALNTRLWKRAGAGGPLRRLGEAVYAPADPATPA
ncbi:hypothetical protein [uncultured Methylobacterium sp.]|uniref:hypothetical protein n=1 Tax=uncultured Methylobacterium sp. TaxID=157278 RepID=UPI0035CC0D7E